MPARTIHDRLRDRRVLVAAAIALTIAACFPAFDFSAAPPGGDGGVPDASGDGAAPSLDARADGDAVTPPLDAPVGATDAPADGADGGDAVSPVDASDAGDAGDASDASSYLPPIDASDMVYIEGGSFLFPNNFYSDLNGDTFLDTFDYAFLVDKYEVTNARFAAWVASGQNPPFDGGPNSLDPSGPYESTMVWNPAWNGNVAGTSYTQDGTCTAVTGTSLVPDWNDADAGLYPVACVNWWQAVAFCAFEGKRVLTESEWAYVALGRGDGYAYPWGDAGPGAGCDYAIWSYLDGGENDCHWPVNVGSASKGASRDGVFDMAGSEWEWIWDWYGNGGTYLGGTDYLVQSEDGGSEEHLVRGGSWADNEPYLLSSLRAPADPSDTIEDFGIRCAKSL